MNKTKSILRANLHITWFQRWKLIKFFSVKLKTIKNTMNGEMDYKLFNIKILFSEQHLICQKVATDNNIFKKILTKKQHTQSW